MAAWYPLPVASPYVSGGAPPPHMPFGFLPPSLPLLSMSASGAVTPYNKRPYDATTQGSNGNAAPAAYANKYARSSDDAGGAPARGRGRGAGRGGARGGRGGMRGGMDRDSGAAVAAVPHTPGFLPDGRPDLSMYLTPATPAAQSQQPYARRAPPPGYAAAAAAAAAANGAAIPTSSANTVAPAAAAAPAGPAPPVYCQAFMQNLCPHRSCDAKDDNEEDDDASSQTGDSPAKSSTAAAAGVGGAPKKKPPLRTRCEFVHDEEFRRTYLARNQYRATNWAQAHKPDAATQQSQSHAAHRPNKRGVDVDDESLPTDGKLRGLKAPVKESALLRKLLSSELRVESSRVLQAIRHLVAHQCLDKQRADRRRQKQLAEEEYQRSKRQQAEEDKQRQQQMQQSPEAATAAVAAAPLNGAATATATEPPAPSAPVSSS